LKTTKAASKTDIWHTTGQLDAIVCN